MTRAGSLNVVGDDEVVVVRTGKKNPCMSSGRVICGFSLKVSTGSQPRAV